MKQSSTPRTPLTAVTILVGLFTVVLLIFVAYLLFELSFPVKPARSISTLVVTVIPAPTATLEVAQDVPGGPTATPTAVPAGQMGIGAYVQITGTGGDGLRLRAGPGKDNAPLFLGGESEVFQVKDGPKQADGYTWWFLVAPYDAERKGWAAEAYLAVVTNIANVTPTP